MILTVLNVTLVARKELGASVLQCNCGAGASVVDVIRDADRRSVSVLRQRRQRLTDRSVSSDMTTDACTEIVSIVCRPRVECDPCRHLLL